MASLRRRGRGDDCVFVSRGSKFRLERKAEHYTEEIRRDLYNDHIVNSARRGSHFRTTILVLYGVIRRVDLEVESRSAVRYPMVGKRG